MQSGSERIDDKRFAMLSLHQSIAIEYSCNAIEYLQKSRCFYQMIRQCQFRIGTKLHEVFLKKIQKREFLDCYFFS